MQGNWQMTISAKEEEEEEEEIDDSGTEIRENVYLDSSRLCYVFWRYHETFPQYFFHKVFRNYTHIVM